MAFVTPRSRVRPPLEAPLTANLRSIEQEESSIKNSVELVKLYMVRHVEQKRRSRRTNYIGEQITSMRLLLINYLLGCSQAVKATDFDSVIRRFDSRHPSHLKNHNLIIGLNKNASGFFEEKTAIVSTQFLRSQ